MPDKVERPLSPHLQIYSPQLTSVMSIFHRFTGFALAVGTAMIAWLLIATALGEEAFGVFSAFVATPLGKFMIFGWSAALYYHLCNGIRHLIWDKVKLFKIEDAYKAGYIVMASTVILTIATWWFACSEGSM